MWTVVHFTCQPFADPTPGADQKRVLWPIHSELLRMCTRLIRRPIPCATLFDVGELKKLEKVRVNARGEGPWQCGPDLP
jgi:hypothetical protein